MRHDVTVRFPFGDEVALSPAEPLDLEEARRWLDGEFIRLECEPARASGKVLFADKILAVADAAGPQAFADAEWADRFARATLGALGRTAVIVNLAEGKVGH